MTHKGFQNDLADMTGAAVTTKGVYVAPGASLHARLAVLPLS